MTKADLITIIANKLKFPWARAELLVDAVFGCLEQSMSRGEKIEIRATHPNYPYTREFLLVKERLSPRTSWANGATRRKFDIMRIPRMSLT